MPSASTTLTPEPSSSRACRRFLTATLASWGADEFTDDGMLLSSELVTNAVLHAGTEIEVVLHL
ncbi:MAG: ATP-binding protein, partial [Actinomycetota bacterium]|nr:ATP-binding protein [Actinomycetota bacterium]